MLTVWCVLNGTKYADEEARLLRAQVARHLRQPHAFRCLSDRLIPGVDCVVPEDRWPGWWAKLLAFRYARAGLHLYLDLDSVVVGPLEELLSQQLSAPKNWAQSGFGGIQSSVMSWGGDYGWIADQFDAAQLRPHPDHPHGRYGDTDYWGDQGFLTAVCGEPGAGLVRAMQGVFSYRYHCQHGGPPAGARVVQFHGSPKPAEVSDAWVQAARSSTTTRT